MRKEKYMEKPYTLAWRQFEAGREYKRRIGLYETVRRNERYYRGDQWYGTSFPDLPRPVFNIIKRIVDYLVCTVASGDFSISYADDYLPFAESRALRETVDHAIDVLNRHAAYRWDRERLEALVCDCLLDAALSGDGIFYCYWDPSARTGTAYTGDIVTGRVDNVNFFVADVNRADIQSQEYIILSGRADVSSLRREAKRAGVSAEERKNIVADSDTSSGGGDYSAQELDFDDGKATYIIKFYREDGYIHFEKSVKNCLIRHAVTPMKLYPVAYFNWIPTKDSFHGTSPVTALIPNQKYINLAYAMVMKHMSDTAFSKVVYDKSRIPEWTNEVGEAIAAVGGGNISDAVSVLGVGQMQDGYLELIESAVSETKELSGATKTALGDADPTNTSAIIAMQESARLPLSRVRASLSRCLSELAAIWADMLLAFFPDERPLLCRGSDEKNTVETAVFSRISSSDITAKVEVGKEEGSALITTQSILDKLLASDKIDAETYVALLPPGILHGRSDILEALRKCRKERKGTDGN